MGGRGLQVHKKCATRMRGSSEIGGFHDSRVKEYCVLSSSEPDCTMELGVGVKGKTSGGRGGSLSNEKWKIRYHV